jgi:argininosuccinate synthase
MIDYCQQKGIPVKATVARPYSSDENCLHISYEAGKLEDPNVNGFDTVDFGMTVSPQQAPDQVETVTISFESGVPIALNGRRHTPLEMVTELNAIGGRNGVGRVDVVENRFVGMKSRGVYEAPGMTVLYTAHHTLEASSTSATAWRPKSRSSSTTASGTRRRWTRSWHSSARPSGQ